MLYSDLHSSTDCLPADPVGWYAVQGKQCELKVVCGARSFFASLHFHSVSIGNLGQWRGVEGGGWRGEGAQVELGQVIDGLC